MKKIKADCLQCEFEKIGGLVHQETHTCIKKHKQMKISKKKFLKLYNSHTREEMLKKLKISRGTYTKLKNELGLSRKPYCGERIELV